ncbi:glycoside hydrolase family 36 protein [Companilactobacillus sp. HBUAS59544]|uniref:glycoside hydrolase family 36 protein n=1 Tax=Companilactobacillus sp. HBUAS59544 TaxID=3109363 RepID=UPI002FEEBFF7
MSKFKTLNKFILGDIVAHYFIDENKQIEWTIYPKSKIEKFCFPNYQRTTVSLVQAKIFQDSYDKNFGNGMTMLNSQTSRSMTFVDQKCIKLSQKIQIQTILKDEHGNIYHHYVNYDRDSQRIKVWSSMTNMTSETEKLEFLSSFVLNSLSPFHPKQLAGNLDLIRLRSKWSMEGRIEQLPVEKYDLEKSWKASGIALERFSQYGTMPVRRFFPFLGLKDHRENVTWLAEFDALASWQMNAARVDDRLIFFGGLPDADNGNWYKLIQPNESYQTPKTTLTVGQGKLLQVSRRLQVRNSQPMSIIYNEWGTSWGHPNEKLVEESVDLLKQHQVDYYVIDAGWYRSKTEDFNDSIGDWNVDQNEFPQGLAKVVNQIHSQGMKAGIWFEFEGLGKDSQKYQDTDSQVKRDNWPVTTLKRRFLNMTLPEVQNYLKEKVITLLKKANFDYLKIDYNDSIGIGADGADSLAEGLQQQIQSTLQMISEIYQAIPNIKIENCSSGGHRLTLPFIENTDLSSFSDAHETDSIPLIACNELNIIPASKNLIWCTIHPDDSIRYLQYHLIATFLGRICMSGDIRKMSNEQWNVIDKAFSFYKQNSQLISQGIPFRKGPEVLSYQNPNGYLISGFINDSNNEILLLVYQFRDVEEKSIKLSLDEDWQVVDQFGDEKIQLNCGKECKVKFSSEAFSAHAFVLKR